MIIMDDGIALDCVLTRPEGAARCPAVLLLHGFTGHKDEPHLLAMERVFLEAGVAVLRADLYGHGRSGGQFRDHHLYKWLSNTMTLLDDLRHRDFVTEIYLCGHSQGGLTAMLAAAMERDRISGLIALSPAAMIPEGARRGELLGQHFDPERIPECLPAWGERTLGGNYIRVAQTIRVEDAVDRYRGPVLLVHGACDGAVPVQVSIDAAERYHNAELKIIPEDGHCYENHLELAAAAVREWMTKRLREKGEADC